MTNYVQSGEVVTLTAPYAVSSGGGALVGGVFGVATADVANAAAGEFMTEGVFDLTKDSSTFSAGDRVFWDDTNKCVTSTAAGNKLIGRALASALTGDATARVLLNETMPGGIFQSAEQTGTGSSQNVAHGLGVVPRGVIVYPTDLTPTTLGSYVVTLGSHTSTNVVLTVTSGKKFIVIAIA